MQLQSKISLSSLSWNGLEKEIKKICWKRIKTLLLITDTISLTENKIHRILLKHITPSVSSSPNLR